MNLNIFSNKNLVKYFIIIGLVYCILKCIPSCQINNRDILLIILIILFGVVSIDMLYDKSSESFTNETNTPQMKYDPNDWNKPSTTNCDFAIESLKNKFENEINELKDQLQNKIDETSNNKIANKYLESLIIELNNRELLNKNDIENIKIKIKSRILSVDEAISSLEILKNEGKGKLPLLPKNNKKDNDNEYNELPSDFMVPLGNNVPNEWSNEYSILNTDKWKLPTQHPPVCVSSAPCKVCPTDSSNYPLNLMKWNDARKVSNTLINKQWANDQMSSQKV